MTQDLGADAEGLGHAALHRRTVTDPARPPPADDKALVRATFESAPDGLVVVNAQGQPVAFNPAFIALWQFPPDMLQRRNTAEMRDHLARQLKDEAAYRALLVPLQPGVRAPSVGEFEHRDGRVFERKIGSLASAGYPGAVIVRWRNVTERRRAEAALRAADQRLAAVFNHALNAILLADDQRRYVDANPAACTLLGRSREQVLGITADQVMDMAPEDADAAWSHFLQQGSATGQVTLRLPDGRLRVARFSAVANIQPGVHLSILSDVTDEVQARQHQLETAAQMDMAMANADIVFWAVDLVNDQVTSANPQRAQQMLGYASDEIPPGLDAWDALVHPDDFERRESAWLAHVQGHSPTFEAEFRMRHKDGRWIWLLARGRATERDAQGRATRVVGTRIDITRRKQAEQLLEAQAFTDGLTGTLNRRRFLELADVEMERARRHGQPMSLLMIDLDHFKSVNDAHGHAGGDSVLQAFVKTAQTVMRGSDLFGRVGGEEFAALLPQTDLEGAAALAHRLQEVVHEHPVVLPTGEVAYSVSIGVAARAAGLDDRSSVESLMLGADAALYRAKGEGRDRVLLAGPA